MCVCRQALVLGMGLSGVAAACLLRRHGYAVTVVDAGCGDEEAVCALQDAGVEVLAGAVTLPAGQYTVCVVSPGISCDSDWVREMQGRGAEVISELELGYRYCDCELVAVTGSNGKSTLVKLLYDMLRKCGQQVAIAGNYGIPLSDGVKDSAGLDLIVVEVSSFQLELVDRFSPKVGVLLNLQPDHLDRHGTMAEYRALKQRLFRRMGSGDCVVVHDAELAEMNAAKARLVSFGILGGADFYYSSDGYVCGRGDFAGIKVGLQGSRFDNQIMGQTVAAAVAVLVSLGLDARVVAGSVMEFSGLPHRMEQVAEIEGVRFIDDSKATNLAAMQAALEMLGGGVRLIAGGVLKEKSVDFVKEVLANKAPCVYLIGIASKDMESGWRDSVRCVECGDLETAVRLAFADAGVGETVLLSPGCASFDQFKSYKDRGERFKRIVEDIYEERETR
jgi:UDP-N-acetylmuramoylalanine--D-glutamate ligase